MAQELANDLFVPTFFTHWRALWCSSWLPLAMLALHIAHATLGVRLPDLATQVATKIAHCLFKGSERAENIEL